MATTNSALSFQGLSTGIQTDALVSAILAQEGQGLTRLQARQTSNSAKTAALNTMKSNLGTLFLSLATLKDKFDARTVASSDANGTYVSATGFAATNGNYDITVAQTATKARISSTLSSYTGTSTNTSSLTFTSASASTFKGSVAFNITSYTSGGAVTGTFTVSGTDYVLTGSNGVLSGGVGTPLEGLNVAVSGTGSGVLKLAAEPSNLAVADPAAAIFSSTRGSFAVKGTDGIVKAFELTSNSLNGLRDAINASGAAVTATVINTGAGSNPYQLVITAKETGTGTTSGEITLAAIANSDASATSVNVGLGITAGVISGTMAAPTALTGGLASSASGSLATDAMFTLNGIQLTRKTNVITDAADGMTFTLKQGGQVGTTSLTVAQDKATATAGIQDVISKYNVLWKGYKDASTATKNADGSIKPASLSGEATSRAIINQIKTTLAGGSSGLSVSSAFQSLSALGIKTGTDGNLSLDTTTFQAALVKDPIATKRLFTFSGDSTNGVVTFQSAGANTATGDIGFTVTKDTGTGALGGVFTGTYKGAPFNLSLTASNGTMVGAVGTPLEGLTLAVTAAGSGTLSLSRGAGQAASDLATQFTAYNGSGSILSALQVIDTSNRNLSVQINAAQAALNKRKNDLQTQFSRMEVLVAQMRAAASSLTGA